MVVCEQSIHHNIDTCSQTCDLWARKQHLTSSPSTHAITNENEVGTS